MRFAEYANVRRESILELEEKEAFRKEFRNASAVFNALESSQR